MPAISKQAKPKKRSPAGGSSQNSRVRRKRTNRQQAPGPVVVDSPARRPPQPSMAELERMFEEDSDTEVQVNNPDANPNVNNVAVDVPPAPFVPTLEELEEMFQGEGVIELQVISNNMASPSEAPIFFEGQSGLLLPSVSQMEQMFEEGNDEVELQVINANEDSGDAHSSE